jgi:beta-glucosidase-like glycosyl hydrolase
MTEKNGRKSLVVTDQTIINEMINEEKESLEAQASNIKEGVQSFVIMTSVQQKVMKEVAPVVDECKRFNKISEKNDKTVKSMLFKLENMQSDVKQ